MKLTEREKQILVIAIKWYEAYDDCNPEVGMGPFKSTLVDIVCDQLSFAVNKEDRKELTELI
jgi:hypothetical protein